jgi:hypothetical protein
LFGPSIGLWWNASSALALAPETAPETGKAPGITIALPLLARTDVMIE